MRSRLLEHLYTGFDKDPDATVALSLSHAQGVAWKVSKRRLIVKTESGTQLADLSLSDKTLDQVAIALELDGVTVSYRNPDMAGLLADVLIDSAGVQSQSNGDSIKGHRSVLWAFLGAYAAEVAAAADRVPMAIDQTHLHSAGGDWLDYWGGFFKVARRAGQSDADYLTYLVAETLRHKSNKYAIENAVHDATGDVISIDEPWARIFILDGSTLSGPDKIKDGLTIGRNMIRPTSSGGIDWLSVMPVINRIIAAGTLVLPPLSRNSAAVDAAPQSSLDSALTRLHADRFVVGGVVLLDYSDIEDVSIINSPALWRRIRGYFSLVNDGGLSPVFDYLHSRNYRFYTSFLQYPSAVWPALETWGSARSSWSSLTVGISIGHSRS